MDPVRSTSIRAGIVRLASLAVLCFLPSAVSPGQQVGDGPDSVFPPADRTAMQRLTQAGKRVQEKHYAEAVQLLGGILELAEDAWYRPNREEPIHRSLKAEAQRLIGTMPSEGRAAYELQYGARARRMLEEAARAGDTAVLAEVSRRFFHTEAGYEATHLLGTWEMDQGRPLAAALCFKRLQDTPAAARFEPALSLKTAACWMRAGMVEEAAETLAALKQRLPEAKMEIAGRAQELFKDQDQAVAWLTNVVGQQAPPDQGRQADQWPLYRGSPSRNAASAGSSPLLNRRWAIPVSNDPHFEKMVAELRRSYLEQGLVVLSGLHPLAVRDYVFLRSVSGLEAVDFRTGKRVWNGPVDEAVEQLLEPSGAYAQWRGSPQMAGWLDERVWGDATYGTLSSDGERVFSIEDLGTHFGVMQQPQAIVLPNGRMAFPSGGQRAYNRLAAYEIATEGKLEWEIGAEPGEEGSPLAGAFFLGPPLPLADQLYAVAEIKREIRLVALDAKTGQLEWSQQLAVLEKGIVEDPRRRVAGLSPSYADGVLVCPTSAGAAVAVDLTTRSLLWGYQYAESLDASFQNRMMFGFGVGPWPASDPGQRDRWSDACATIAEGRVLLTPLESAQVHCLNLVDGRPLWAKPREDGLYVGCVHDGKVLIVGHRSLRALKLADGEPAWREATVALPTGSSPSGRGFFTGERYYLPLTSAEVAAIELGSGRIVARSKSRTGAIPGNLICYEGAVISQGVDYVESFYQLEDLRRQVAATLAEDPDDSEALARQGELLLDEGKLDEAVAQLRRSFELRADSRTRELLVDALLEGLRLGFAAHHGHLEEIERLAEQPAQRAEYLRVLAAGLQQSGQVVPAFEAYLRIIALGSESDELERVDNSLSVRRARWVQARLAALRQAAKPAELAEMDKVIRARFAAAIAAPGPAALREALDHFGSHPAADEAREQLALRLVGGGALLEAEQLLRRLERSAGAERARAAVARLARMLDEAGRPEEAAAYYERLAAAWGDDVCLDGKTGRQLVEELPADGEIRRRIGAVAVWPEGRVDKEELKGQAIMPRSIPVEFRGPQGPPGSRMTVELDQQQQLLVGRDSLGRESWRVAFRDPGMLYGFSPGFSHVRADGHFLLLSMGVQLVAVDTLGTPGKTDAHVLWKQDLSDSLPGMPRQMGFQARMVNHPWGLNRLVAADANGRPLGNTGPVGSDFVCFQRLRNLMAVHPLTGQTLWTRHDLQPASEVFGDDSLLFVTPPGSTEALVLRTLDGHDLGRRRVAPAESRVATLGRRILTWSMANGKSLLKLTDAWDQEDLWQREFDQAALGWPVGEEAIGVLERDGHFVLLSLPDGATEIDAMVDAEPSLAGIYVLRSSSRDLLVTNRPRQNRNGVNIQDVPGQPASVLVNGFVHGFDRRTKKKVFSTRIEDQGLLLQQPSDLPILTFAANIWQQTQAGRGQTPHGTVVCLDTRNGRIVLNERLATPIHAIEVAGVPERQDVVLKLLRSSIRLSFTGEPYPADEKEGGAKEQPPDEPQSKLDSTPAKAGRAVLRGLRRFAGSVLGTPPNQRAPADRAEVAGDEAAAEGEDEAVEEAEENDAVEQPLLPPDSKDEEPDR